MAAMEIEKQILLEAAPKAELTNLQHRPRTWSPLLITYGSSFLLALMVSAALHGLLERHKPVDCLEPAKGYVCRPEISRYWGQYSPYFSISSEIPEGLPEDCEITFAQILSRHGARAPTLERMLSYNTSVEKVQATARNLSGKYAFLKKYRYNLGVEQLNAFGKRQLYDSGVQFYKRYKQLAKEINPFIRSSGQQRVVDSASSWMEGFYHAKPTKDGDYPYPMVIINEGPEFNNTLKHGRCTNIEEGPLSNIRKDARDAWGNVFLPSILIRLREELDAPELDMDDAHNLMSMCPFDTVGTAEGRMSPFCDLFTVEEWNSYNHFESLEKFYGWGKGNPLGPSQGVGFTNELIARMTHKPVHDQTSTNRTLDENPKTFPVDKKHKLFADFSHDNDLTSIFFASGLFNSTPMLSITQIDSVKFTKGWSSSRTVPFASRAYFEKMRCKSKGDEELVRVLVNDRVIPLDVCGSDKLGRCTLSAFINSLSFARHGGNWDMCFLPVSELEARLLMNPSVKNIWKNKQILEHKQ